MSKTATAKVSVADPDVIIIGSGFGGSVSALRLAEKGYKVVVLEAGARFKDADFAKNSLQLRKYLFQPKLGCYGIQRIDALRDCLILSGAGVGGGSLVYGNTLYEPPEVFYQDPAWAHITDWKAELAPHFDQAKRMLGVVRNPISTPSDEVIGQIAEEMGVADTFAPTQVGVFFGEEPGQGTDKAVPDPFFGGAGPERTPCRACGECMSGCRHNSKNTLVKNYLYLAEQLGVQVFALSTVTAVVPIDGGYEVEVKHTKNSRRRRRLRAPQVIFAAAALGTQRLLHQFKDRGLLPGISNRLGYLTRTNSESILGGFGSPDKSVDYSYGAAITSSFYPDSHTHIEPVRFGKGSNFYALMLTTLTDGDGNGPRWWRWLKELIRQPKNLLKLHDFKHGSERSVITLVMQSRNNSLITYTKSILGTKWRYLTSKQGHGEPNPTWIPVANQVARRVAQLIGGTPGGSIGEPFNRPITAHFLGGCTIGTDPGTGVVDPYHRLFGYPGLHVIDGSTVSANLGVNPSLTITAQAERAISMWPNKGQPDPRPAIGSAYQPVAPIAPLTPAVPANAPAALRLLPLFVASS